MNLIGTRAELEVEVLAPLPSPSAEEASSSSGPPLEGERQVSAVQPISDGGGDMAAATRAGGMTLAGVPLTPEVTAIVLVYFVQGILGRGATLSLAP